MNCSVCQLGLTEYSEAYALQVELLNWRINGEIEDTLLLLEHTPTVTLGKSGKIENILVSREQLAKEGISVFCVGRGGDVTYHGPGQLVGYLIFDLRSRGRDVHRYVHDLEEVIIRTVGDFGIKACRDENHAGVWVGNRELAAVGLSVRKWVTMHGFALNVNTDLRPFSFINPCGFTNRKATSMSNLLSQDVPMETVIERLLGRFSELFNTCLELRQIYQQGTTHEKQTTVLV